MCSLKSSILFIFYLYLLNASSIAAPKKWPSQYPRCYRDDPNLNKCMVEAATKMKPYLTAGIPDFNIPPISPFHVPEVVIQQGSDSINYKVQLKNLVITGFDSYEYDKFDFNVKNLRFESFMRMGALTMESDYSINGKVLAVPIEGKGRMKTTIGSANGTLQQDGKLVTRKGNTYLELNDPVIKISVGEVKDSKYDGLFDGNEVLARAARKVLQDNERDLIEDVTPAVEKIIAKIVLDIEKKSIGRVPFDELYPIHS